MTPKTIAQKQWEEFLASNYAQGIFSSVPLIPVVSLFQDPNLSCQSTRATLCLMTILWGGQALGLGFCWRLCKKDTIAWAQFLSVSFFLMTIVATSSAHNSEDLFRVALITGSLTCIYCRHFISTKATLELQWDLSTHATVSHGMMTRDPLAKLALLLALGALNLTYGHLLHELFRHLIR